MRVPGCPHLHLVEMGRVEHVLAPALYHQGVVGDVAVGGQHLQPVATQRRVASKIFLVNLIHKIFLCQAI